jgi:hypothetical protein
MLSFVPSEYIMDAPRSPQYPAASNRFEVEGRPYRQLADRCCSPSFEALNAKPKRSRLGELDAHLHCSVIGTCLSTVELRRLIPKFCDLDRANATDLEIHEAAVELSIGDGRGCRAMQKLLDERYSGAVRQFAAARDPEELLRMWASARKSGDIPPAYWALMTHPEATVSVRQVAFGDLHMLSHLVGSANRADIRRLVSLEQENVELHDKLDKQQARLVELGSARDDAMRQSEELAARLAAFQKARPVFTAEGSDRPETIDAGQAGNTVASLRQQLELANSRCQAAEQRAARDREAAQALRDALAETLELLQTVQAECAALEAANAGTVRDSADQRPHLDGCRGKRLVYVGGRPGSNAVLKRMVETAGGQMQIHDGGLENRKGLLPALLPGADLVVFPVDCIDHDSMNTVKRICERHGVDYVPLRTASVASFLEWAHHRMPR